MKSKKDIEVKNEIWLSSRRFYYLDDGECSTKKGAICAHAQGRAAPTKEALQKYQEVKRFLKVQQQPQQEE